jgi:ABC-type transporter Mla MlaB component
MLRIITEPQSDRVVLRVEGSLRGPWVTELERIWERNLLFQQRVGVDLADVSYVDDAGKALLTRIFEQGTELTAEGPFMQAIVQEIKRGEVLSGRGIE